MIHKGTKKLETNRLILRKFKIEDANCMYNNWACNPNVSKYVTWEPHKDVSETKALLEEWIKKYNDIDTYKWVAEIKDTKEIIGSIDVVSKKFLKFGACEIGYCYGEKYWNKGYATECLIAVMKYLFDECDAYVINAKHLSENPASGKVMQKCGMKYEGTLRARYVDSDGVRNDLLSYSITKDEYEKIKEMNA